MEILKVVVSPEMNLTEVAGHISVSHISWETHADHCPLRQCVLDSADSVLTTGGQHCTGVATHLIETSQSAGTVSINATLGLRLRD